MNYAIFRTEPIYKSSDLGQIGSHNKREKKAYQSNKDIDVTRSDENITIIDCDMKYIKKFDEITKEYKKEHDIRMKTMRDDRKKTFHQTADDKK
jgi:Plasmid recombination enzyme.